MAESTLPQEHFYVYVIFDLAGVPRYVGKGNRRRWTDHAGKSHSPDLTKLYASAGGALPIVKVRENVRESAAFETEVALIAAIGRADYLAGPLLNHTDGGDGGSGALRSPEFRAKLSAARLGKPRTAETIAKMRASHLGIPRSQAAIEKHRAALLGRAYTSEHRAAIGRGSLGKRLSEETKAKISISAMGNKRATRKLTESNVLEIRARYAKGETQTALANVFGVGPATISAICLRKKWRAI